MSIVTRAGKGAPINADEHDRNLRQVGWTTVAELAASTQTGFSVGSVLHAEGWRYEVVAGSETDFDVETAGGVKLRCLPDAGSLALTQAGTTPAAMQKVIDRARTLGVGVHHFGSNITVSEPLVFGEGGLTGSFSGDVRGTQHYNIRPNGGLRFGHAGNTAETKGEKIGDFGRLVGVGLGTTTSTPIEVIEGDYFTIDSCGLQGPTGPENCVIDLRAVKGPRIADSHIRGTIRALPSRSLNEERDFGVKGGVFTGLTAMAPDTAFEMQGDFVIRDVSTESGFVSPKFLLGETGHEEHGHAILEFIYHETALSNDTYPAVPYIDVLSEQNVRMNNCILYAYLRGNHPTSQDGTPWAVVKHSVPQSYFSARDNWFRNSGGNAFSFDLLPAEESYHQLIGNTGPNNRIRWNGVPVEEVASLPVADSGRKLYIRDETYGEVSNLAERNIWVTYTSAHLATYGIRIEAGKHHAITQTPTGDIVPTNPGSWRGAEFRIHFNASGCILKHGSGFFQLAKGSDVAVPENSILEFVVDRHGNVREVGTASLEFGPA